MNLLFYDMSLKDYRNEKVKANLWEKIAEEMRVSGYIVSGILTFSTEKDLYDLEISYTNFYCSAKSTATVWLALFLGRFVVKSLSRSDSVSSLRGQYNMQICHSLRCKQIGMSTADQLISTFRNNAGPPLSTLRSNAATLTNNSTFPRESFDAVVTYETGSKLFERLKVCLWV